MKLKKNINYSEFFRTVQTCEGEVILETPEGDQLNLKSTLSQFVFTAAICGKLSFADASIRVEDGYDINLLRKYTMEE